MIQRQGLKRNDICAHKSGLKWCFHKHTRVCCRREENVAGHTIHQQYVCSLHMKSIIVHTSNTDRQQCLILSTSSLPLLSSTCNLIHVVSSNIFYKHKIDEMNLRMTNDSEFFEKCSKLRSNIFET